MVVCDALAPISNSTLGTDVWEKLTDYRPTEFHGIRPSRRVYLCRLQRAAHIDSQNLQQVDKTIEKTYPIGFILSPKRCDVVD